MANDTPFIIGMRDAYFDELYKIFQADPNAVFITADNGAPTLDKFASDMPDQYYQVGIAEQQLFGLATGLATEGRQVYTYAIMPFVTLRPAEFVKLDQCAVNLPIINIGVGAGFSYDIMGPTHHTVEDIALMRAFPNLTIWSPSDAKLAAELAHVAHAIKTPQYIRFDRAGIPVLYPELDKMDADLKKRWWEDGMVNAHDTCENQDDYVEGDMSDVTIVATGRFVHQAIQVANHLWDKKRVTANVIDVFRLKPFNYDVFLNLVGGGAVVTYEEHQLAGGLGSIVLEAENDAAHIGLEEKYPILRLGVPDKFTFDMGGREVIWKKYGLDPESAAERILAWL